MSEKCENKIKFKKGETATFKLYLKTVLNNVTRAWNFPATDADINSLTLTIMGADGNPVVFDFDNGVTAPTNEAITITDRDEAELTVILSPAQTESLQATEEGCPTSFEVKVDQNNPDQEVKCFQFIEEMEIGQSLFAS